jgi:hypothetical protein
LAVLAVRQAMAIDPNPHRFFLGRGIAVDIEQQLGAFDFCRGDVENHSGPGGRRQLFGQISFDPHFVAQQEGGRQGGLGSALGVDKAVVGEVSEVSDRDVFHGGAPAGKRKSERRRQSIAILRDFCTANRQFHELLISNKGENHVLNREK